MSWEILLRVCEVAFAAGGAMMWVRGRIGALDRQVHEVRTEQTRQGVRLNKLGRTVHRMLHRPPPNPRVKIP